MESRRAGFTTWDAETLERVCPIPGGLPIFGEDGEVVGSVGVSGMPASGHV
jgi:uncharacterized protein GlcG (DUF336 family)